MTGTWRERQMHSLSDIYFTLSQLRIYFCNQKSYVQLGRRNGKYDIYKRIDKTLNSNSWFFTIHVNLVTFVFLSKISHNDGSLFSFNAYSWYREYICRAFHEQAFHFVATIPKASPRDRVMFKISNTRSLQIVDRALSFPHECADLCDSPFKESYPNCTIFSNCSV